MHARRPRHSAPSQAVVTGRGVTLLEMLVSLAILALVATMVSQALTQLALVERLLQGTRLDAVQRITQAAWLSEALESMVPTEADSAQRFVGKARELSGLSTAPPTPDTMGIARVHLAMVYVPRTDETELRLSVTTPQEDAPSDALLPPAPPVVVSRWRGAAGQFRYLDLAGRWTTEWLPVAGQSGPELPLLPQAIHVVTGQPDLPEWVVRLQTSPTGMPSRKRFLRL
jgi:prepilin-type N-terminal cleavage/methylation domain-containing protein